MRYQPIDRQLFIENRKRFASHMKEGGLAIFHSNDVMPTNADGTMPFKQNADLFYLSGVDQEETMLVIFPGAKDPKHREILFVRETNEEIAIWEGAKLDKEAATRISGIAAVYWTSDFEKVLDILVPEASCVYLNTNEHHRAKVEVETRDARFLKWTLDRYKLDHYEKSALILHNLRMIKNDVEVALIQKACDITEAGFRRILSFIRPGVMEYEIEAELAHEFLRHGSRGFAYTPIIASGFNACVLHYIENDRVCMSGDVILLDVAAEYANYASDLTRSVPVNGKYTSRQRDVYNAVLRVMKQSIAMLVPGNTLKTYHEAVGKLMEEELIKLGLLNAAEVKKQDPEKPLYKKYFMHGTSHHMGLDVHDVTVADAPFAPGMVFTCEPGIYIREENLGIRLENDILITENGPKDLMASIPLEVEEIEDVMNVPV
ncbi:MAG: aminopeptidase P N-terminal domain-containing protein [Flavobacteriales bacterium]|nr:aminopeptidase P N-terminal domain-containing protein [Flavobacteriales bacterium]MCB9446743.1 aminopeptidase P N-terminal domain-containing protein [Flavobacteriales bacterium]